MTGKDPISYARSRPATLIRIPLEPRHVELIVALDDEWLRCADVLAARKRTASPPSGYKPQAVSPTSFDAVFG